MIMFHMFLLAKPADILRPQRAHSDPLATKRGKGSPLVFSSSCKLLLPQPFSIYLVANCPGGRGCRRSYCFAASAIPCRNNSSAKHMCNSSRMNRSKNAALKLALESTDPEKVGGGVQHQPKNHGRRFQRRAAIGGARGSPLVRVRTFDSGLLPPLC
jgi:hypothetical protein